MLNYIKKNRLEFIFLLVVLLLALFLRLYKIDGFMTFLGDEGRDVRIVRDLITEGNLVFIGPQTSVGNMYLGPLYYYMMAPALFLSGLNPVGPAIMVALLSVLTVWLTWFVGRKWFGKEAAFIAALLYAVSPTAIIYGRTSWNPNPMPLFSLLSVWGIYEVFQNKKYYWLPVVGISTAFSLQMHYLGLLLLPTIGIFWLLSLKNIKKDKLAINKFFKNTVISVLIFLFLMLPLVLFDLKHQGMNLKALGSLVSTKSGVFNLGAVLTKPFYLFSFSSWSLLSGIEKPALLVTIFTSFISAIFLLINRKKTQIKIIFTWIFVTVLGLSLYNQPIYIHYLGLIYPAIFLLFGALIASLSKVSSPFKWVFYFLLAIFVANTLRSSPAFDSPNYQLRRTEEAADLVIKESLGEPFNFGLIAKSNYDESYRYFLENKNAALEKDQNKITKQLFVICEDGDKCKPQGHSQYQIAVFGIAHIDQEWQIDNIKIYRLIPTK